MNPFEWRIEDIERTANEAKRRLYELDALNRRMDGLESSVREARAEADGFRNELQASQEKVNRLESRLDEMANDQYRLSEVVHGRDGGPQGISRRPGGEQLRRRACGPGFRMATVRHLFYPSTVFPPRRARSANDQSL
jgi:hypothetical protein